MVLETLSVVACALKGGGKRSVNGQRDKTDGTYKLSSPLILRDVRRHLLTRTTSVPHRVDYKGRLVQLESRRDGTGGRPSASPA